MRSSISSSRPRWLAGWLLTLVLVAAGLAAWEAHWRDRSFVPSLVDNGELWALSRRRANALGSDAVVLVGSSRMQMNIHKETFADATGWPEAVQLAAVRGASVPVLESLAEDPDFHGRAIVEVNAVLFFARTPRIDGVQRGFVEIFEGWTFAKNFEQRLRIWVQERLVTRLPSLSVKNLYSTWWTLGRKPRPGYNSVIAEDRFRYGDYYKFVHLERANRLNANIMRSTTPRPLTRGSFASRLANVEKWVRQIRGRGGDVIFVHLPSSLHVLAYEERWFERAKYWDVFANFIDAPAIHYLDYSSLADFSPKDGDHFDRGESVLFAKAFGDVLVELSLAPGPGGSR